jgi:hypothetical protein
MIVLVLCVIIPFDTYDRKSYLFAARIRVRG